MPDDEPTAAPAAKDAAWAPATLRVGDRVRIDGDWRHGELLDVYDDRFGPPVVWRVLLFTGEIVMQQDDRLSRM